MYLSEKLSKLIPSGTVAYTALIQELRDEGRDVIDLAVGEPDFDVDPPVMNATRQALDNGYTRYGPVAGLPALRDHLSAEFEGYRSQNILVTNGAKQGLFEVFQVICDAGREVIISTPCWVSFEHQVKLAGGVPVLVPTAGHQIDGDAIAQAVTDRTVAVLANSPNNPTGAVYDSDSFRRIADICFRNDLWLISDEAYASFVYGEKPFFSPFAFSDIRSRLIVIRSFSKTYAMTGFRVGYVAAPEEIITRLSTIQGHLTGNVCTFAQHGALSAAEVPPAELDERRLQYEARRNLAMQFCRDMFDVIEPDGAFYLFPNVNRYQGRFKDDLEFARHLLEEAHVAVVPGRFFGAPGHIRISFATSTDRLMQGLTRIKDVL